MKYKIIPILIVLIILILIINIIYFTNLTGFSVKKEKIKIGIMTPITGGLAFLGENIVKSAELARDELGYIERIEFIVEDAGKLGNGGETISAYRKLVDVDKVQIIIDGMTSDGTLAVAPLLEKDKI
jgi:ABC-type branched-subunit amino acid transport system substrate-binding protein